MKTITILFSILILGLINVHAQELYSRTFGKITQNEASITSCDYEPDAEAIVLYEMGKLYFRGNDASGNFDIYLEKSVKIKILKQAGIKYGEYEIPFYIEKLRAESINSLEAITYNYEDGKLIKSELDPKNIFEEKINENWRVKKFAMPNVKEGSIIEIKYTLVSPYLFNAKEWNFQRKIPVLYSSLEFRAIPYYEYTYIMKGSKKFDEQSNEVINNDIQWGNLGYKEVRHYMAMKQVPSFKDEDFITSEDDYMISLNFQLSKINYPTGGSKQIMSTWPALCNDFLKDEEFGKYIKSAEKEAKKIIPTLGLETKSEQEKIETIVSYVKTNFAWNSKKSKFSSNKLSDFLKQKTGNSADLNLFLLGMFNAAEIKATPVLLSTRDHGVVSSTHPFQQFLNYVIVSVQTGGDSTLLLDATETMLPYDKLPSRCTNVRGLLVEKDSDKWIDIIQDDVALTERTFNIKCSDDLSKLITENIYTAYNYDAYNYRRTYYGEVDKLKEYLNKKKIEPVGEIKIQNYSDPKEPFIFSFKTETNLENASNKLFISPFLNQAIADNWFKQAKRTFPVDLIHRQGDKYKSTIQIPEGYKVEYLPQEVQHDGRIMKVNYSAVEKENQIEVTAGFEFKDCIYPAKDYQTLKSTFDYLIKTLNEMIILSKK